LKIGWSWYWRLKLRSLKPQILLIVGSAKHGGNGYFTKNHVKLICPTLGVCFHQVKSQILSHTPARSTNASAPDLWFSSTTTGTGALRGGSQSGERRQRVRGFDAGS
jgi:hypothetical protein